MRTAVNFVITADPNAEYSGNQAVCVGLTTTFLLQQLVELIHQVRLE
jgi:hypothetical protein